MTPEVINIAIAEHTGTLRTFYCSIHRETVAEHNRHLSGGVWICNGCLNELHQDCDNYYDDLNAIQAAVLSLPKDLWMKYGYALWNVLFPEHKGELESGNYDPWSWLNATAPQRCEAYLKMIGKWVES